MAQFVETIDCSKESVVITNPRASGNPIVWVTEPWQDMCGFTYGEAVGKNARLTQGDTTDPRVVKALSSAIKDRRPCKVQLINYRGGAPTQPFWNILSISPLEHRGELQLFIANLQDYSYHMSRMISLTPSQFCRVATHYMSGRRLGAEPLTGILLAKPTVYEADADYAVAETPTTAAALGMGGPDLVKRLGWNHLPLEPEHLADRMADALSRIDAAYETSERLADAGENVVINATKNGVAMRVTISEDKDGHYSLSCTRLTGGTFTYHDIFRKIRDALGEQVTQHPLVAKHTGGL